MKNIILCINLIALNAAVFASDNARIIESFNMSGETGLSGWSEKSFLNRTHYSIVEKDNDFVLHARGDSAASGLIKKIEYDPTEWPVLSWRWNVVQLPEKGDVRSKKTDDYGARVYVVFPHFLKWKTKTISYIWARTFPKGESTPNAWLPNNAVMFAVQSGADSLGKWIIEKRNVYEDFEQVFGHKPPNAGAIAIMSDADNTGGIAEAFYDDLILRKE